MAESEPRSTLSVGMDWASRVSTIGLEFALPALLGAYLDRYWSLRPLATVLGAVAGFAVGMIHVLRLARQTTANKP